MYMGRCYMTMIILVMIFLSNPVECLGQDIVNLNHIVQRGETIESLADKYRLTTDILKTANFGMDVFYTGLEVFIPVDKKYLRLRSVEDGEKILNDIAGYFIEYQEASRIFNSGDYKKAAKLFVSTIRNYGKYLPCEEAYFGKAMCDYNCKKWNSAIEGFSQVINLEECSEELRRQSRSFMANAEEQCEARSQRTANFFSGLFQVAASVGTAYVAAKQASDGQAGGKYSYVPGSVSSDGVSNMTPANYSNISLAQLANYSVLQVQQQWRQEEMQVKSGFASTYRQLNGKEPSAEEVEAAYYNYLQTKSKAYSTMQKASNGLNDSEMVKNRSSSINEVSSSRKCIKLFATDNAHCNGNGICSKCNGNKKYFENGRWVAPCIICGGSGLCPSCHGVGER